MLLLLLLLSGRRVLKGPSRAFPPTNTNINSFTPEEKAKLALDEVSMYRSVSAHNILPPLINPCIHHTIGLRSLI